jgi:hypothetical protein
MPLRAMPRVGLAVTVIYLDSRVPGVVTEVLDGGRRLMVTTVEQERIEFVLGRATASFTAGPGGSGPRLIFGGQGDG